MESSKTTCHTRSISLPSRSHPLKASIENHLCRLQSCKEASSSGSLVCQNLSGIKDLYEDLDGLIQFPKNQKVLYDGVEGVLEGSLVLLDVCGTTMDVLSQLKDCISDLSSSLRRRNDSSTAAYVMSRKKIIKMVSKCLENLKKSEKSFEKDGRSINISLLLQKLRESEATCLSTLRSVLAYISESKVSSKGLGWSKVAKLMKISKRVSCDANDSYVFERIEGVLDTSKKSSSDVQSLLTQLEIVEMDINEIKDTLESVSRCLVKTRVSLLNVVSQ